MDTAWILVMVLIIVILIEIGLLYYFDKANKPIRITYQELDEGEDSDDIITNQPKPTNQ